MSIITHLILVLSLVALLPAQSQAQGAKPNEGNSEYQEAIQVGVQEFNRGKFQESYAAMRRAHALEPSARTFRGMALALFELGRYVEALDNLEQALTDPRKPLSEQLRANTEALVRRTRANVATIDLSVTPNSARVRVDDGPSRPTGGRTELRVNLGAHVLDIEADGHQSRRLRVHLAGGEHTPMQVDLQPEGRSARSQSPGAAPVARDAKRIWGQVTLAVGSGAIVGGLISVGLRQRAIKEYNSDGCAPDRSLQCGDQADRASASEAAAIALFAAGGVLAVTGTTLLWTARRQSDRGSDATARNLRCQLGTGVMCRLQF